MPAPHRFSFAELRAAPVGISVPRTVRFQEVDAAGIVFFATILEYLHDGYVVLMERAGGHLPQALIEKKWAAPLRHAEADFLRPMRFGDAIEVQVVRVHVDESDLAVGYRIALADGSIAAVGQTNHVLVEPLQFRRIPPPPWVEEARRLIEK